MPSRSSVLLAIAAIVPAALLAACSSCDEPASAPSARPAPPPPPTLELTAFRLPNGLEVELVSGPCGDEAAIAALIAVGADHDPPERSGMTHVIERIVSASLDEHERFESARDHALYSSVVAPNELVRALERLANRLRTPEITDEDVARAKTEVLADIANGRGGDATLTALRFASESVAPSRGNGARGGVAAEVELVDRPQVEAFWRAHYAARNTRLVVAGRFDAAALRARIEPLFAPLPAGEAPTAREAVDATVTGTIVMGSAPTALALAVRAPAVSHPLYPAFLVLAARATSPAEGRTWQAQYDPIREPELLLVTGTLVPGEQGEAAANALRRDLRGVVVRPFAPSDVAAARRGYARFVGIDELDPATCASDVRALVVHRARRAQLGLRDRALADALDAVNDQRLGELTPRFERPTVVLGGGELR